MPKRLAPTPCAVSRAGNPVLFSTKKRSSSQTGAFPLPTSTHWAANVQVRQIQNGIRTFTYLLSLFFSATIIVITLLRKARRNLAQFGDRQCCDPGTVACRWYALIGPRTFAPNPKLWIHLLTTVTSGVSKNTVPFLIYIMLSSASVRSIASSTP